MNELVNDYRNEKTLLSTFDQSDISNFIDLTQESCCFGNQDSISPYAFALDQTLSFENHIDILTSYPFSEIEL